MKVGSFFPEQEGSVFYAMGADDCSLFFDLADLTEKQKKDHGENIALTAALQVALIALGKPIDYIGLFDRFAEPRWAQLLDRCRSQFIRAGFQIIPPEHVVFGRVDDFYDSLVGRVPDVDLVNLYMVSGTNSALHRDPAALARSRNLNSKFHFAANAPAFGLPVPSTFVTAKSRMDEAKPFLEPLLAEDGSAMLKINGLAGARNVTVVHSLHEARAYVAEFADDTAMLFQKRLDTRRFTEMTADLRVTDTDISIANIRRILFSDGVWVGNHVPAHTELPPEQAAQLIRVGEYARAQGLSSPEGHNCGIDYFVGPEGEIIVTEINVRWTGGLFPTQAVKQLHPEGIEAVVCFDLVATAEAERYFDFIEASQGSDGPYECVCLGFSPFEMDLEGAPHIFVWHQTMGDFAAFQAARSAHLPAGMLPTAGRIVLSE